MSAEAGAASGNPYPGLRPFNADETHLFFGRDLQRIELLHRLRRSRFLAIVGSSGSGKSSLVRAGLLPGLHGGFMAGASSRWRIVDMRPGTDAIGNLARALDAPDALRDSPPAEGEPSFTQATLRRSGLGLAEAVREARLPDGQKVLVLVDQFEELFRSLEATDRPRSNDDAQAFVTLLLEAVKQHELPIYIVLTMRSEFLGECMRFRGLPEAINGGQYLVPRLTPDQRAEAITGPAAVFGVTLVSTLVNRLLNDVGENPDQLPILQHALMRTWDGWRRHGDDRTGAAEIGLADYEGVGGMAAALSLHADAVFEGLADDGSPQQAARRQVIAQRLFKCLATVGAGGVAVRRFATVQEIVEVSGEPLLEVVAVVDAFRAAGHSFLMPPPTETLAADRQIDISHESLIRNWPRMRAWVDEETESARVYERLSATALLHGKGEAALWDQPDLGVALRWRSVQQPNAAWARRYNAAFEPAMAFLDASVDRAQALEDARGRRQRAWLFGAVVVLFVGLTGVLSSAAQALQQDRAVATASRQARWALYWLSATIDVHRAREGGAAAHDLSGAASKACAAAVGMDPIGRWRLLAKLCEPGSTLTDGEVRQLEIYQQVRDGRWRDARHAIAERPVGIDSEAVSELLGQLAAMRWPAARSERQLLLELSSRRAHADVDALSNAQRSGIAGLVHPVHRRIAAALTTPEGALSEEEKSLLVVYDQAERARTPEGGDQARQFAVTTMEDLRHGQEVGEYGELAAVALIPDPALTRAWEGGKRHLHESAWISGILLTWPLWRLRRLMQRRSGEPIRSRFSPIRRALAALFDLGVAAGIGVLVNIGFRALVTVGAFIVNWDDPIHWDDLAGQSAGVLAGAGYLLGRDSIRLRFRRSIGKLMFDLRPVAASVSPDALTWRMSMLRNALLPGMAVPLYLFMLFAFGTPGHSDMIVNLVFVLAGLAAAVVVVDFARGCFGDGETFGDKWSNTRVVDADCAVARPIRP